MDWLLKIVEGPMQGAEIALDAGRRVTFGRDSACDIVVADAALAERAFALEVSSEGVTLVTEGGESRAVRPFEVWTFGVTGFALGPAEGTWEELRRPAAEPEAAPEPEPAPTAPSAPAAVEASAPAADAAPAAKRFPVAALAVAAVALVLAVGAGMWFWLSRPAPRAPAAPVPTLDEVARSHGLVIARTNGVSRISGNVRRRTERLAIRALAQRADAAVRFDLTDDESLAAAAEALLFTVAEGRVKVAKAENRRVTIAGWVPTAAALGKVLRAMAADVPGLVDVDASAVKVGEGRAAQRPAEAAEDSEEAVAVAAEAGSTPAAARPTARPRATKAAPQALPVAGILTEPYRCVVLKNGTRWIEGAYVGSARLVSIEADRLTFEENGKTREWRP